MKTIIGLLIGLVTGFSVCYFFVCKKQKHVFAKFSKSDTTNSNKKMWVENWTPITYGEVQKCEQNYDKAPLLYDPISDLPYEGFRIDSKGVEAIRTHLEYKQLYLRLGQKDDGEYTILVLPLDAFGRYIQATARPVGIPDDNYDQLDPCPDKCP